MVRGSRSTSDDPALPTTGRRLSYARHLMNGRHPLVGRVLANRIWLHHMGRGMVETPGDFGVLGQRPTHPELLDWLADEMVRQGWSLKAMHRLIMTSSVYRQSSQRQPSHDAVDSSNTLYGRYPVRRLDAEVIRDRILAVSGRLDLTPFGPPVAVAEDAVGQVMPADDSGAAEHLPASAANETSLAARWIRCAGHGRELRPQEPEHLRPSVADAHEQRLRAQPRPEDGRTADGREPG